MSSQRRRRAVLPVAFLCLCAALGQTRQNEFQGLIAQSADEEYRRALVRVFLVHKRAGVMYRDRFVSDVKVSEKEFFRGAVIHPEGFVLAHARRFRLNEKRLENIQAWVETPDGRRIEAHLLGADYRLDLILLQSKQLGEYSVLLGKTLDADQLHFLAPEGQGWALRTPHYIRIRPETDLAAWQLEVNASNVAASLGGMSDTFIFDSSGEIAGLVTIPLGPRDLPKAQAEDIVLYYALPAETLRDSVAAIKEQRVVPAGFMGFDLQQRGGRIEVTGIWPGRPAEKAGFKVGDVILEAEGRKLENLHELGFRIRFTRPGEPVSLLIQRGASRKLITAEVSRRNQATVWAIQVPEELSGEEITPERLRLDREPLILPLDLGLELEPLKKNWARKLGFGGAAGVMVRNIVEGSPAEQHFQVGDIITKLNGKAICCLQELRKAVAASPDAPFTLKVFREGKYLTVTIDLR